MVKTALSDQLPINLASEWHGFWTHLQQMSTESSGMLNSFNEDVINKWLASVV